MAAVERASHWPRRYVEIYRNDPTNTPPEALVTDLYIATE
jgi:hypothetical protein